MALLVFSGEAGARMRVIEKSIEKFIFQFQENTEAAIVIFALTRLLRRLIRVYPKQKTRDELLMAIVPFLEGKDGPDAEAQRILTLN